MLVICCMLMTWGASAFAQGWAYPARTPNTPVVCTGCPGVTPGSQTVGYSLPIAAFTGRFLDSQNTRDYAYNFRTARAFAVLQPPGSNRIYFHIGSAIFAYDANTFFSRLEANTPLTGATFFQNNPRLGAPEQFLMYDSFFYPEYVGELWPVPRVDGQDRMNVFDVDDQGHVYMAAQPYGWGIAKDTGSTMDFESADTSVGTEYITVFKTSASRYFTFVGLGSGGGGPSIFDVTNRTAPIPRGVFSRGVVAAAKNTALDRIAILDTNGALAIYTGDALSSGGSALLPATFAPGGVKYLVVTSDGTNFYAGYSASTGIGIAVFAPNGSGYSLAQTYTLPGSNPVYSLQYGAGYLTVAAGSTVRVAKIGASGLTELTFPAYAPAATRPSSASYFAQYYAQAPSPYVNPSGNMGLLDSLVIHRNNKDYLILCGKGLGDVYEIRGGDTISVTGPVVAATANPRIPATAAAGPYYGDPVSFRATGTGALATANLQWNFDNAEGTADPNVATGVAGTSVTHRYSGLSAAATRTVRASSVSDASVFGVATVQLKAPTARVGVTGQPTFITAASTSPEMVVGDTFFDGSDGSIESHYDAWSLDGAAPLLTTPAALVPVGACSAQHTLRFDAHYGPYTGTAPAITSLNGPDYSVGIRNGNAPIAYSVRPFAAGIAFTSTSSTLTFTSTSRASGDSSVFAPATALTYKWELIDGQNAVVGTAVTGTATIGAIPSFPLAKNAIAGVGYRVRLTLTSPTAFTGTCAGMEQTVATTVPLNGPDPVINGDCTNGGPPCNFSVASLTGVNQAADGWTYQWSASGAGTPTASVTNANTYAPVFTVVGGYTVSLTVTNALGFTKTVTKAVTVTTAGTTCDEMTPVAVFISYSGKTSGCSASSSVSCTAGEDITFTVSVWQYNMACNTHTFAWTFGDGSTATTRTFTKKYAANGQYTANVIVNNGAQSITLTQKVTVAPPVQTCTSCCTPGSCLPPPGSCEVMTAANMAVSYAGATSGCSSVSPTASSCKTAELLTFNASPFGYNMSCATHTFIWRFGDGSSALTQMATHAYAAPGTYNATVDISNAAQTLRLPVTVVVDGGGVACGTLSAAAVSPTYSAPSGCTSTNPSKACTANETVSFNVASSTYSFACATHTFQWNFGDGTSGTGLNPTHRYATPGDYTASVAISSPTQNVTVTVPVKVSGGGGGPCDEMTPLKLFIIYNNASGTCNQASPNATCQSNELLSFNISTFGYNINCATHTVTWDFGDGGTASGRSVTHTFARNDSFTVRAVVNNGAATLTLSTAINISGGGNGGTPAVTVSFTAAPMAGVANGYIFTPSVDVPNVVTKWLWDFGDGNTSTATGTTPTQQSHIYSGPGPHHVTLRVQNSSGADLAQTDQTIAQPGLRTRRAAH
jgi:PKD repeat protein